MTPAPKTQLLFYSPNDQLSSHLKKFFQSQPFQFTFISDLHQINQHYQPHYLIALLPPSLTSSQVEQIINQLHQLAYPLQSKIAFILLDDFFHPQPDDRLTFIRQQLTAISPTPLHRLILSQNLYSTLDTSLVSSFETSLLQIIKKQKITITRQGNHQLFPTSLSDLLTATLKSLFLQHTNGKEFVVTGEDISDLSLSYLLKKKLEQKDITLDIDTILPSPEQLTNWQQRASSSQAQLNWRPQQETESSLGEKIDLLLDQQPLVGESPISSSPSTSTTSPPTHQSLPIFSNFTSLFSRLPHLQFKIFNQRNKTKETPPPYKKKLFHKIISYSLLTLLLLYIIPSLLWFFTLFRTLNLTSSSFSSLRQGDIDSSTKQLVSAQRNQQFTQSLTPYFNLPLNLLSPHFADQLSHLINLLGQLQSTLYSTQQNYLLAQQLYYSLLDPSSSSQPYDLSLALQSEIGLLHHQLDQLYLSFENQSLPFNLNEKITQSLSPLSLENLQSQTTQAFTWSQLLTQIIQSSTNQNFLLIFQDPYQLRPSGGLITSAATFSLVDHHITNFQTYSLDDLSSRQTGQLTAPEILQQLTGQENITLTDLNHSPDFTLTAAETNRFFTNFLNFTPDTVIYLNVSSIIDLLQQLGEININNQSYTADNLKNSLLQSDLSTNSLLLQQLTQTIFQQLRSDQIPFSLFVRQLLHSYQSLDLQVFFTDPTLENLTLDSSLSGYIPSPSCHPLLPSDPCLTDIAYFNEANYTNSPLTFYQQRQINHQVEFSPEGITHQFTLDYQYSHSLPNLNRPYTALYQVILPPSSSFLTLKLDNDIIDIKPLVSTTSAGLSQFQFSLSHPLSPSVSHQLIVSFLRPWSVGESYSAFLTYSLLVLRQPGTLSQPYQLSLLTPSSSRVSALTTPLTSTPTGSLLSLPSLPSYQLGIQYSPL